MLYLLQHSCTKTAISGFVLAGGRSSRLHQDKVLLPWNGGTLLDHAIQRLQQVSDPVRVCADRQDLPQPAIPDALPNAGPLAGIVAGLEESETEWNLFLAVDLPLLPVQVLQMLALHANDSETAVCVLPQVDGRPQPLCGLYHRALLQGLRNALNVGKYKVMLALEDSIHALPLSAAHLKSLNAEQFQSDWFLNINTPNDLQRARELSGNTTFPISAIFK